TLNAPGIVQWDGQRWSGVGGGLSGNAADANGLGLDASSSYPAGLFIGGEFDFAGDVSSQGIALWRRSCADETAPRIHLASPRSGLVTSAASVAVSGSVDEAANVTIAGQTMTLDSQRAFSRAVSLVEGNNSVAIVATDAANNVGRASVQVVRDTVAPTLR